MKLLCCATLLAFVLIAPAAQAARPPRDTVAPSVPTGLRVVSVTEDSVTLAWNASTDNSGSIHHYVVSPGSWHPGNSTTKTIGFLVPNYTQTYRVSAADASGNESAFSAPLTVTTAPDVTAPTAPTGLNVTGTTESSVSLAWTRSTDRWALWYEILMDDRVIATASSTSTRVRHIRPGSHKFEVRARDVGGNISGLSNAVTVVLADTGDVTPPVPPSNLTATDLDDFCGSVLLEWGKSAGAIEYEIYLNGAFFSLVGDQGWAGVYAPNGSSTWTVVAVDAAGNSSDPSNAVTLSVVADPNLC
jgi:chitodextrinase